jgi:acyl-CoA synthetase (AMP-forming)/AMP-acid ligase II
VPAANANPTEDELRVALRDRISSFKIPRRIVFITDDEVPRTTTGKVRLGDIAELIESHPTDRRAG